MAFYSRQQWMRPDVNVQSGRQASTIIARRLNAILRRVMGRVSRRRIRLRPRPFRIGSQHELLRHWEGIVSIMLRYGGASMDNAVKLYFDGDEAMEAIWNAIDSASRRVWVETYILEADRVGKRTIEALAAAAARGCEVILLYDAVGSSRISDSFLEPLRAAGGQVYAFNPLWRWQRKIPLLRRDHRKIIIVDDDVGFCGGMNLSEDYAGPKYGNGRFRDCHAQLAGPCVRDLASVFASSLQIATGRKPALETVTPQRRGERFVQVLESNGWHGRRDIQRALRLTIRHAALHCYITTPYFLPPKRLVRAINRAAKRGVDVRILTAGQCDVPMVRIAAQHIYGVFLRNNVRIFEMFDSTLHAKTMAIDGLFSTVGSFNLDTWSDKRNLEVKVAMVDPQITQQIEAEFLVSAARACEVTLDTWQRRSLWRRIFHWAVYQLMQL